MSDIPTYTTLEEADQARQMRIANYAHFADQGKDLQTGEDVRDSETGRNVLVHHKAVHAHYDRAGTFDRCQKYRKTHPKAQWKDVWVAVKNNYCDATSFRTAMHGEQAKRRAAKMRRKG